LIGIICPRRNELSILSDALSQSDLDRVVAYQHSDDGPIRFSDTTRICLCTVHGAKGLEFRAAHIAGAEFFKKFREPQRRMAYTAITRAKTALTVYHAANLTPSLTGALAAANPPPSPPDFDSLFEDA
jgi:superfamily I DNA/RNA helicase